MGGRCGVVVRRCGEVRSAVAMLIAAGAGPACADRRLAPGDTVSPPGGVSARRSGRPCHGGECGPPNSCCITARASGAAAWLAAAVHPRMRALDVPAATCLDRVGCLGAISPVHLAVPNRTRSRTPPVSRRRPPICTRTGPETQSRPRSCQAATRPPQVTMTPADAASAPLTDPRKQRSPASGLIPVIDSA
jgi:hypothetical protein